MARVGCRFAAPRVMRPRLASPICAMCRCSIGCATPATSCPRGDDGRGDLVESPEPKGKTFASKVAGQIETPRPPDPHHAAATRRPRREASDLKSDMKKKNR